MRERGWTRTPTDKFPAQFDAMFTGLGIPVRAGHPVCEEEKGEEEEDEEEAGGRA
jgi:hypothetical protein